MFRNSCSVLPSEVLWAPFPVESFFSEYSKKFNSKRRSILCPY